MAIDQQTGTANIRATFYDTVIKQVTARAFRLRQAFTIEPTAAWNNYFFRESQTILAGQSGNAIGGIARGANYPQRAVEWERVLSVLKKYGLEDSIHWEDIVSNNIDVQRRTLIKIAEGVTKAWDDDAYNCLTESQTDETFPNVQTFNINGIEWDQSSAAIIDDFMRVKQLLEEADYPSDNVIAFVSPKDHRSIVNYLANKGAQFPKIGTDMAENGKSGNLAGIDLVMTRSVAASRALFVIPKRCATYREAEALTTDTVIDPHKSVKIRSTMLGSFQLTDPKAVVVITGTQKGTA